MKRAKSPKDLQRSESTLSRRRAVVQKGKRTAFTCLGNWYDLADRGSCADLLETLASVTSHRDKNCAIAEIVDHAQTLLEDEQ